MSWNYRVCTKQTEHGRIFTILPVYYDLEVSNNGKTVKLKSESWGNQNKNGVFETYDELNADWHRRQSAFGRPIIDLDNFPNLYNEK